MLISFFNLGFLSVQEKANGTEGKKHTEYSNKMHFKELSGFCVRYHLTSFNS